MKSQAEMDAEEYFDVWIPETLSPDKPFLAGARKFLEFAEANAFPVRGYVHKAVTLDVLRSYLEGKE